MFARKIKTALGLAAFFCLGLSFAGTCLAADAASAAADVSNKVDQDLQRTAGDLTRELDQATNQIHESQRLGTPTTTPNRYGDSASIDREIGTSTDEANAELRRAAQRDDYTFQRRELENTRSLYYPNSADYNRISDQINRLDQNFSGSRP